MMERNMLDKSRPAWINDRLNQTLVAVATIGAIAVYLIVARGWAW
jgi:hypothetical protein